MQDQHVKLITLRSTRSIGNLVRISLFAIFLFLFSTQLTFANSEPSASTEPNANSEPNTGTAPKTNNTRPSSSNSASSNEAQPAFNAASADQTPKTTQNLQANVDEIFGKLVSKIEPLLFFKIPVTLGTETEPGKGLPLILALLIVGGVTFSFYFGFVNVRLFKHAIQVVKGKFDRPGDTGEITHFQALTSALSATVGLGNIAGVAVAISKGGAGAVFWMWLMAFFGMSMKFTSCTLSQLYRRVDNQGRVLGGPMVYLESAFKEKFTSKHMHLLGKGLAILFSFCVIGGSLGGGNLFQSNQSYALIAQEFAWAKEYPQLIGIILAFCVGIVIIGGIRRIGDITSKLVPSMCLFYCSVCLCIVLFNLPKIPDLFSSIFTEAFSPDAMFGGFLGVLITGITRAAFSNEAGLGSAAIAHAAAKTNEPVREGAVAMLGPFIDTILVCTMTALAILITQSHLTPGLSGVEITAAAFSTLHPSFSFLLMIAAVLFAYSTAISWSYYGERAVYYLFGERFIRAYQTLFVLVISLGPSLSLNNVINFSDMMILSLAFPNIIGLFFIVSVAKPKVDDYIRRLKNQKMQPYK